MKAESKDGTHGRKAGYMGEGCGGGKPTKIKYDIRTYMYENVVGKPSGLYDNLKVLT